MTTQAKSKERVQLIRKLINEGLNLRQIGERLNLKKNTIWYICNKNKLLTPKEKRYNDFLQEYTDSNGDINCARAINYGLTRKQYEEWLLMDPKIRKSVIAMINQARARARERGIECNIKIIDIWPINEYCPILGLRFEWDNKRAEDNSPSLDRVDNDKGYVSGNVMMISYRANRLKSNGTVDEFKKIIKFIEQYK